MLDVENLARGSERHRTALRGAYRDHSAAVYSVARALCGKDVAADVTKEVFLRLSTHPERFSDDQGSLRAYLLRATREIAVDTTRLERRPRPLDTLSANEREAIIAVYYGGCTSRDAALALGLSEGAVKRVLRVGLRKLRDASGDPAVASPRAVHEYVRMATASDPGPGGALDSRAVVAHAQGVIMEREGASAGTAYNALLELSDQRGMTLPTCAEALVTPRPTKGSRRCFGTRRADRSDDR